MDENNNNGFILINNDSEEEKAEKPQRRAYKVRKPAKNKKGFRGSAISYICLALVCSLLGGFTSSFLAPKLFPGTSTEYSAQAITINTNDNLSTVSAVAKKAMGSVVGITTVETQLIWPFSARDISGVGSGVIVHSDGYILTNSHVIANGNAKELKVLFENGEQVNGTVLWNDSTLDLAIVKVNVTNLPVADLGDSDSLEVGEIAIAIGNPLGLEFERTVTSGIISGLNRDVSVENGVVIENLIQTDASINPGNSGGPLLNGKGEVIGINTAKISSGEGLGFAIPINEVKSIAQQIIETGTYKTVFMGIKGIALTEYENRLGVDLSADTGVLILEVESDSPAAKSGLQSGDIITKIDDKEVEDMSQLKKTLYNYKQGDKANLSVIRNTEKQNIEIEFTVVN
ncbi:trypsin-like peptidase domain-containing protein [Tissierella sp. Yu-01]|uniref:serine protease HtrA n=1 Tax=Tissierella sp. Yu-01 TaxID=3035694 RepID=UPI00240E3333|nr:trypsin-like peptidase domain-containing protein [Tissierella sp. Yu-01]WFA08250.1 trypsin-like peptidase domain-containing protein [Tissierella sp. Yu-01]